MWSENKFDSRLRTPTLQLPTPKRSFVRWPFGVRWLGVGVMRSELGVGSSLKFPEFGELQEDGVGIHDRQGQAGHALAESAPQDVIPEKGGGRMCKEIECIRAAAAFVHLLRRQRGVGVDAIEMIAQIAIRIVLSLHGRPPRRAANRDRFMHVATLPSRLAPIVQTHLIVGIEVGRSDPPSEMIGDAWNPVAPQWWLGRQQSSYLGRERRRYPFVGVDRENPVMAGEAGGEILLVDVAGPCSCLSYRSLRAGDGKRVVRAARVDDDDLVGPGGTVDGISDMSGFVERDDSDRDTRHGGDVIAGLRSIASRPFPAPAPVPAGALPGRSPDR